MLLLLFLFTLVDVGASGVDAGVVSVHGIAVTVTIVVSVVAGVSVHLIVVAAVILL